MLTSTTNKLGTRYGWTAESLNAPIKMVTRALTRAAAKRQGNSAGAIDSSVPLPKSARIAPVKIEYNVKQPVPRRWPVKIAYEEEKPDITKASVSTASEYCSIQAGASNSASSPNRLKSEHVPDAGVYPPADWQVALAAIKKMRAPGGAASSAAVDSMGCDRCHDLDAPPAVRRFQILVAAMLSSQTRDEVTHAAVVRLRHHGLDPANILRTDLETLKELLKPVGFYPRKAEFLHKTCSIMLDQYNGDVPDTMQGLLALPGIGPKMAHLTMNVAWNKAEGICVDVHVDRIAVRLGWAPETPSGKKNRSPEDTRKALQEWLPRSEWMEINPLLVGLGQTICTPRAPKCGECSINHMCPSAFKQTTASPRKPSKES
mmetsp:Transcript_29409/g.56459  ORF Transcript_29409/g.56459 Transcript_29409/m.56459 type:complete len:374 (+) Transcript_29409:312-1433(+)